jgi:probable addiction module antidote protein
MTIKSRKLDEYLINSLKDPKEAQAYMNVILEDFQKNNDFEAFSLALEILVKAQGSISQFANETDVSRTHLYRIFNSEVQPQFVTIANIFKSLGFKLSVKPIKRLKTAH